MLKKKLGLVSILIPLIFGLYLLVYAIITNWDDIIYFIKFILHSDLFWMIMGFYVYWGLIGWCFPYEPPIPSDRNDIKELDNK